ncbi:penicillin-binding protein 2 [Spirochaeta dissipatitropha]
MISSVDRANSPLTSKTRVVVLAVIMTLCVLLYTFHLFSMQVVDQYIYLSRAELTTRRSSPIPAKRGEIYDRHYSNPVAANTMAFAVDFTPADAPNRDIPDILSRVSEIISVPLEQLQRRVPIRAYNSFSSIELAGNIEYEKIVHLSENLNELPGVNFYTRPVRYYPDGSNLAHILGFVGEITPEELQVLFNRGYAANSLIGKSGIERQYDSWMQGQDGRRYRRVDAQGRQVQDDSIQDVPPRLGHDLVLSIDSKIQDLVVKALGPRVGAAVVLRPHNGEILAMASYPSFDPNLFIGRDSNQVIAQLSRDQRAPFINRVVQASGAPASTVKILLTAAVIEENAMRPDETINTRLFYEIGNRRVGEWGLSYRVTGFGPLALHEGLANSSNFFFATVGHDILGTDTVMKYYRDFGLGIPTGIDLPVETAGLMPSREWKQRVVGEPWVGGDTVNLSLGQGFVEATPLQIANAVSLIVNNGTVYRPHILKEIRDQETGEIIESVTPNILRTVNYSDETFRRTQEAMRYVITDGTANAVITTRAVKVAGKTGTAEVGREENWHSWFAAYGPYEAENPEDQVVVVVWVDAENDWEWWAPKASDLIFHGIFSDMTYEETIRDLRPWYL